MMVLGTKCFPQMCEDLSAEPQNPHKANAVEVVFNPSMHSYLEIGCGRGKVSEGLPGIQDSKPREKQDERQ